MGRKWCHSGLWRVGQKGGEGHSDAKRSMENGKALDTLQMSSSPMWLKDRVVHGGGEKGRDEIGDVGFGGFQMALCIP